ncbi:hypothetical protein LTR36_007414 [Oleoguttula mirabilis]|uniref:DUF3074 domain-containing protein n=1 Tax=Oleoguttula mirabilis TaxID=1507867 RepID=A0AAV9J9G4_9PEZI|nr:hypothetical protein LTR36_007414 [Oleoguttula mirabilis]
MADPTASGNAPTRLGHLVRMRALKPSELPAHPDLSPQQSSGTPPNLQAFLAEALEEANSFMTAYLPRTFKVKSASKQAPPSTAPVELLSHDVNGGEINKVTPGVPLGRTAETWFARTSVHENAAKEGTASWEEFDQGLRAEHSLHEMEYTPDVQDAHQVLSWDDEIESVSEGRRVGAWEDVSACVMEMVHHIPPPLNDRVFPVLVITAKKAEEFIVVQIPVDTTHMPAAKYPSYNSKGGGGKITPGIYVSIERGELVDGGARVKWQMATASDAMGVLPMWAQKMGVPGAVVKDVGLFIDWCAIRRHRKA